MKHHKKPLLYDFTTSGDKSVKESVITLIDGIVSDHSLLETPPSKITWEKAWRQHLGQFLLLQPPTIKEAIKSMPNSNCSLQ